MDFRVTADAFVAFNNRMRELEAIMGDVHDTIRSLEVVGVGADIPPIEQLDLPFRSNAQVHSFFRSTVNSYALAKYTVSQVIYTEESYHKDVVALLFGAEYKTSVYWPPITGR